MSCGERPCDITNTHGREKGGDLYCSQTCEGMGGLYNPCAVRSSSVETGLRESGCIGFVKGTHIESDNTVQVSEGLYHNLPHVEISVLEKLLHRYFFAVIRLDLELRSKGITSPETSPVC